ncbi:hypothetical protein HMPREF1579_01441 [Gardnerella vaginalis JCP8066]|nr:hypothetical protein HMPREF1579_01441 [Gardnerella vaginalis JCP8066]
MGGLGVSTLACLDRANDFPIRSAEPLSVEDVSAANLRERLLSL